MTPPATQTPWSVGARDARNAEVARWQGPAAGPAQAEGRAETLFGIAWRIRTGAPDKSPPFEIGPARAGTSEIEELELMPGFPGFPGTAHGKPSADDVVAAARALTRLAVACAPGAVLTGVETAPRKTGGLTAPHKGGAYAREPGAQPGRITLPPALAAAMVALSLAGCAHQRRIVTTSLGESATGRAARRLEILSTRTRDAAILGAFLHRLGLEAEAGDLMRECDGRRKEPPQGTRAHQGRSPG